MLQSVAALLRYADATLAADAAMPPFSARSGMRHAERYAAMPARSVTRCALRALRSVRACCLFVAAILMSFICRLIDAAAAAYNKCNNAATPALLRCHASFFRCYSATMPLLPPRAADIADISPLPLLPPCHIMPLYNEGAMPLMLMIPYAVAALLLPPAPA